MTNHLEASKQDTFETLFFSNGKAKKILIPDYQRAYSWEPKQVELFIKDLSQYGSKPNPKGYYFGHFIAETSNEHLAIVDGQQRITTFVLFLIASRRHLQPEHQALSLLDQFSTTTYDQKGFQTIQSNISTISSKWSNQNKTPSDKEICENLELEKQTFTRSQRKMVLALLEFDKAFQKGNLNPASVGNYIDVVMNAQCSLHLTEDKSVAVNIFEMHNTRGVALTTLEVIKAMLMKYVYDQGGDDSQNNVEKIQKEFGEIYQMEERMAAESFRGELTMDQLLRLHLRIVDDGFKKLKNDFSSPAANASSEDLIQYVKRQLQSVDYALNLARELKRSMQIICVTLPEWDKDAPLVGDVMILERDLSCQFFLLACRILATSENEVNGRIGEKTLELWERLLFTRDFHGQYHNLKGTRDDFPQLFEDLFNKPDTDGCDESKIENVLTGYVKNGFRHDRTIGRLQDIVCKALEEYKDSILYNAYSWWKGKMIYIIYKYEVRINPEIRMVMKNTISVEHILPQSWKEEWLTDSLKDTNKEDIIKNINKHVNGIGNLLLITHGENASLNDKRPSDKEYKCKKGSYQQHNDNRERWGKSENWPEIITSRGEKIYAFMLCYFFNKCEAWYEIEGPNAHIHRH